MCVTSEVVAAAQEPNIRVTERKYREGNGSKFAVGFLISWIFFKFLWLVFLSCYRKLIKATAMIILEVN